MDKQNNLIYDYCRENKVQIHFQSSEHFDMINALFDHEKKSDWWSRKEGYVSFYIERLSHSSTSSWRCGSSPYYGYTILSAEEFFTLALPNKSILESIK